MKNLKYYSALLLAATLWGCSNELGDPSVNPDYLEPGTAAMQVSIDFKQPKGYAVGDEDTDAATEAEKEIKSLAFFVKTSHAFAKFYSEDPLKSPNGFIEPLVEIEKGKYTASIKMRSPQFKNDSEVIAIANYKENGLDFTNITTIKQLKEMMTLELDGTANLKAPLLMYGDDDAVPLVDGGTEPVELTMTRLVARLDVVNTAINLTDPTDNFVLTGVRLLKAPLRSMLLPDLQQTFNAVAEMPLRVLGAAPADGNPADDADATDGQTSMRHLYLYETPNNAPANQPVIEVNGTFRGSKVSREIPFKTADEPGKPGEYFAIQRNFRYVLTILPAQGTNEVEFAITAKDWEDGKTIQVKPSMKAPKLESFVFDGDLTAEGVTWDAATTTLTLTKPVTGDVKLTFQASAYQVPKYTVMVKKTEGQPDDMLFIGNDLVSISNIVGYADGEGEPPVDPPLIDPEENTPMPIKCTVTLTLPKEVTPGVKGSSYTNYLRVLISETYYTDITIVYKENREPVTPEPEPEPTPEPEIP